MLRLLLNLGLEIVLLLHKVFSKITRLGAALLGYLGEFGVRRGPDLQA